MRIDAFFWMSTDMKTILEDAKADKYLPSTAYALSDIQHVSNVHVGAPATDSRNGDTYDDGSMNMGPLSCGNPNMDPTHHDSMASEPLLDGNAKYGPHGADKTDANRRDVDDGNRMACHLSDRSTAGHIIRIDQDTQCVRPAEAP